MTISAEDATQFQASFQRIANHIAQAFVGPRQPIEYALICLLSGGHLLLEDVPGKGKTLLARSLARSIQTDYKRIQFTPDLLPSDLIGSEVLNEKTREWEVHEGPAFTNILLADEINRASPKTQSALLEVMEENRITIGKNTRTVGPPFMVIATQNPIEQAGTYPLPEAQLDRFMIRTGIPDLERSATIALLAEANKRDRAEFVTHELREVGVAVLAQVAENVETRYEVLDYVAAIVEATRSHKDIQLGVSVRGSLALVRAAKTLAASQGRNFVIGDDVRALALPVLTHRIKLTAEAELDDDKTAADVLRSILDRTIVPRDRV